MEWKEIITVIASILIPTLAGLGWLTNKMIKLQKEINDTKIEVLKEIRVIDSRLSHLEGYLIGYGQKTGTEKEK